jgi:signal transduction histidine kinase
MRVRLGLPESAEDVPLARRLAWVTGARVLLLVVALGAAAFINVRRGFAVSSVTVQIMLATLAAAFALSGVYAAVLRSGRFLVPLALSQVVLDQVTWTVLVYVTGGAASGATSFYGITCLLGAFLVGLRGSTAAGLAGVGCYGLLALALHTGRLRPPSDQPALAYAVTDEELVYYLLVNVLVLVVVTLLTSYLAERLRAAGGRVVAAEARAESAERLAVLGRLAAGLAHEIRNPLGSIAGSVQLLRGSDGLSEDDRKLCEIIQREASRLNDLVTDMMDVARPRPPEVRAVDAAAVARDVVDLASRLGRGTTDVTVVYSGVQVAIVRADAAQLRQLIWNLVRNGVQASSAGGRVTVTVKGVGGHVHLDVEDEGVGIDEEAKERLFDAFFTTRSHGTGIGLAVVKRIADEHGFTIRVESERGHGARFALDLGPEQLDLDGAVLHLPPRSSLPPAL